MSSLHGPGFDAKVDGRHVAAQRVIADYMYRSGVAGTWTTHKEQAAHLTKVVGGEAFEATSASARMRALRGDPAAEKGGRGWIIPRRRRKNARAFEYMLDIDAGEACSACGGDATVGTEIVCDVCRGTGRQPIRPPDGLGPIARDGGGQQTLADFAAPAGAHQGGHVKA
jgi:hypothetical protein